MATYFSKQPKDKKLALSLMEQLGLTDKIHQKPHKLSQGEQQRLSIARAVIKKPQLVLADEPSASLDDNNCEKIVRLLTEQTKAVNAQLVIVTHDQRLKALFKHQLSLV